MNVTDEMVSRFLAWELPKDFQPDGGVAFARGVGTMDGKRDRADMGPGWWPVGTNLLTADQARAMLEHVLGDALADAARMRWMLAGNGYFLEEAMLCGHSPCSAEEQAEARRRIDEAMADAFSRS